MNANFWLSNFLSISPIFYSTTTETLLRIVRELCTWTFVLLLFPANSAMEPKPIHNSVIACDLLSSDDLQDQPYHAKYWITVNIYTFHFFQF